MSTSPISVRSRLVRLVVAWALVALGVALLLHARLGVAPNDVLNTGFTRTVGLSFGTWFIILGMVTFVLGLLLRAPWGFGTIAGSFAIGSMIDPMLRVVPEPDHVLLRVLFMVLGIVIISASICVVISTDFGAGPLEMVMLGLIRHGMGVVPARLLTDGVPFAIGLALGGSFGVGTVVFVLSMGKLVKFGLHRLGYTPPHERQATLAVAFE